MKKVTISIITNHKEQLKAFKDQAKKVVEAEKIFERELDKLQKIKINIIVTNNK